MVKVAVPPVTPFTVCVPGCIESGRLTVISAKPISPPPTFAVALQVPGTRGAVNVAAGVVTPPVVWTKGVIEPHGEGSLPVLGATVKFTDVPSGTGVATFVSTTAVTADVPPALTVVGLAVTDD